MASLNHKFCISKTRIFLRGELDSSGKTGGGFLTVAVVPAEGSANGAIARFCHFRMVAVGR
jgi:hypothetical protein